MAISGSISGLNKMTLFEQFKFTISHIGAFWQQKPVGSIFRWNLLFILSQLALIFFKFNDLPPELPLYYSLPWGPSVLAPMVNIFLLPGISALVLVLNNFLAVFFIKSATLLSHLLTISSLVISFLYFITLYRIIFLVS